MRRNKMEQDFQMQSNRWIYQHPATIVTNSLKQVLLLLVPVVRALFVSYNNLQEWISFVWVDILALVGMVGIGLLRYLTTCYQVGREGIFAKKGILLRRRSYFPFDSCSAVIQERPFYLRPLRLSRLYLDTDAGNPGEAEFSIVLSKKHALSLASQFEQLEMRDEKVARSSQAAWWEVLIMSFLSSNSLSGILFVAAAISGIGDPFTEDIERILRQNFDQFVRVANLLRINLPPIVAWIAYLLLITWGISFVIHALRTLRFTARRQGDLLLLQSGLLSRYDNLLRVSKINRVELHQSFFTRLLRIESVFARCCGYGKFSFNLPVLLPASTHKRIQKQLNLLLPEMQFTKRSLKPKPKLIMRFLGLPIWWIIGILACWRVMLWLLPGWHDTITFLFVAALFPAGWFLVVKATSYFHNGIGRSADQSSYTLYYTFGFGFYTSWVPVNKITRIQITQSIFQKTTGGCDLIFYTRSEGWNRMRIQNLALEEVCQMFGFPLPKKQKRRARDNKKG